MIEFRGEISVFDITMIAIGSIIDAGILLTLAQIVGTLPSPVLIRLQSLKKK